MQFGLSMFITDETIAPVALGRAAEDAGFESLFVPEHTHIPASRESAWPGGDELPREYSHTLDPFVSLSAIAATTERLRVGTGIALIVERDPITARPRGGLARPRLRRALRARHRRRLEPRGDAQPRHRPVPRAFAVMRERALAMREIWTQRGGVLPRRVRRLRSHLVVAQARPEPAAGVDRRHRPAVLDRVLEYGDGWFPNMRDLDELATRIAELQQRAADAGASASRSPTSACATPTTRSSSKMAAAGVDRVLLMLPPAGADETLPRLERYAELAARHR